MNLSLFQFLSMINDIFNFRAKSTKVWKIDQNVSFEPRLIEKSYRCPKLDRDAKQTLEIRVERKRNLQLGELGEVIFGIYKLGELCEVRFGMLKLGEIGEVSIFPTL